MPKILEVDIKGDAIWVRVEQWREFPSPVTLWTEEEKKEFRERVLRDFIRDQLEAYLAKS